MVKTKWKKIGVIVLIVAVVLAIAIPVIVLAVSKYFTAQEHTVRTDWSFETGNVIAEMDQWQVDFAEAELGDGLRAIQLVPQDIEEEGFSYYDLGVQERLDGALEELKHTGDMTWTATTPLAVLNPYGTGSNGLYLYFETERPLPSAIRCMWTARISPTLPPTPPTAPGRSIPGPTNSR